MLITKRITLGATVLLSLFLAGCQGSSLVPSSSTPTSVTPSSVAPSSVAPSSSETATSSATSVAPSSEAPSSITVGTGESDLFFSEYIEGPGTNKVLELYNPTANTLDLSNYKVVLYSNGRNIYATDIQQITLTGSLAAGETFLIYSLVANSDASIVSAIDAIPANRKFTGSFDNLTNVSNFNGDDALGLFKNGVLIDVFGVIGHQPATSWQMTFANGSSRTHDVVLTRIPSIDAPSVNSITITPTTYHFAFNPLEWSGTNYTAAPAPHTIGTHTVS